MKKIILILLSLVLLFSAVSCVSYDFAQEGMVTSLEGREYKELGKVYYDSNKIGYWNILNAAKELYPECDEIIDIYIDTEIVSLGPIVVNQSAAVATAIQWLDDKSSGDVKIYAPAPPAPTTAQN